jgi:hypothetical protein
MRQSRTDLRASLFRQELRRSIQTSDFHAMLAAHRDCRSTCKVSHLIDDTLCFTEARANIAPFENDFSKFLGLIQWSALAMQLS